MEEDTISKKVAESVISYILSLLPTKDAVGTCVLSKTWMNRWISITKLDLDDSAFQFKACRYCNKLCDDDGNFYLYDDTRGLAVCSRCYGRTARFDDWLVDDVTRMDVDKYILEKQVDFENFTNKILVLTGSNISISSMELQSFSLIIYYKHHISLLNAWIINILTNRRVKNLRIHSSFYKLPFSPLTSHSLLINSCPFLQGLDLLLHMFSIIQIPTTTTLLHFPNLKLLNLSGIFFNINNHDDDDHEDYLTLSLPILNKFEIKNCSWPSGKDIFVQAPLLEVLSIEQDIHFYNLVSHDLYASAIKFTALHLKDFTYRAHAISHQISLSEDLTFLSHLSVKIILQQCDNQALALLLLQQFHQVKSIQFEGLKVLSQVYIPQFAKLSHLELSLVTVEVLLALLQNSPVLETLILKEIPEFAQELLTSATVPDCLASTLQVVKFEKVNGEEHELSLAQFFLENGTTLQMMNFSFDSQNRRRGIIKKEFEEKLYSFKKAFTFSII